MSKPSQSSETASADTSPTSAAAHNLSAAEGELLQLVSFEVGPEEFAIPILQVREINRIMEITAVPQSPEFVEGVINLRGRIIPVMDLRKRFGLSALTDSSDTRIVVVEVAERVIGFTVDRVNEVLRIEANIVEPPPPMVSGIDSAYVEGVAKLADRLLILLDLARLLDDEVLVEADRVAEAAGGSGGGASQAA